MTGIQQVMATCGAGASGPPPVAGFTIGWTTGHDQFTLSNAPGTFPGNMTVSVTGGTPPYTYSVLRITSIGMSVDSPTNPNTTCSYTAVTVTGQQDYIWIDCTVTDSNGKSRSASVDMGDYLKLTMTRG